MKQMELARRYFEEFGRPMIESQFPQLKDSYAAGLAGEGSGCLGYDDEISQDHDFAPGFCIWLKKDDFDRWGSTLQQAYDNGDPALVEAAQKELDAKIKLNAKEISSKYINTPYTTNFAIMFLPFEGIYAEVVRKADLLESLQKNYNIIVTGPTTLAAILNSLQIGFKTLAIQKRSSEVWETLGAVKNEFEKFGGILERAKGRIQDGLNDMDTLVGTRTRAIQRKLRSVESLDSAAAEQLLGDNNE